MSAIVGAAAIGAGASLLGSMLGTAGNVKAAREQREWDYQMWLKQNEYNKPVNQVARMKEAGINPALSLNNITTGSAESSAGGQSPADFSPLAQGFTAAGNIMSQQDLIAAQAREHNANAGLAEFNQQAADVRLRMELQQGLLGLQETRTRIANSSADTDIKRKTLSVLDNQIEQQKLDLMFSKDTMDDRKRAVMLQNREMESRTALNAASAAYQRVLAKWHGRLSEQQILESQQKVKLLYEETKNAVADGRIKTEQELRAKLDNGIQAILFDQTDARWSEEALRYKNRGQPGELKREVYGASQYIGDVLGAPFVGVINAFKH